MERVSFDDFPGTGGGNRPVHILTDPQARAQ